MNKLPKVRMNWASFLISVDEDEQGKVSGSTRVRTGKAEASSSDPGLQQSVYQLLGSGNVCR